LIQLTTDAGKNWQNITPPAVTPWSRVTGIQASHFDANAAYASVDRHQLNDFAPHLYRTRDLGKTWEEITRGLPPDGYAHVMKEDPMRRGLLVAGTERAAWLSFNDGDTWQSLQLNMPVTSVRDFEFYVNDLIVATHGRGFWVIDDISALRQINDAVAKADAFLFKPADAINVIQGGDNGTPVQKDEPQALNPPNGAFIDYYLKSAATGTVTLEILDASGQVLRTFSNAEGAGAAGAGLDQAVMFAGVIFDQSGEVVHREGRRLVHLVLKPDRRMAPQFGMRLVPFGEDLACRHRRAPDGFQFGFPGNRRFRVVPKSGVAAIASIARCPVMRRPGDLHLQIGKNGAAGRPPLTGS
jgi:hypothetical protein